MKQSRFRNVVLMAVALVLPGFGVRALAADHRVGTPEEISQAVKAAQPGDTITMRNGPWRDVEILFEGNGTAEKPVALRAETPGKVVISGRSKLRIGGSHLVVQGLFFNEAYHSEDLIAFRRDSKSLASYCRLTDCAVVDCNEPGSSDTTRWVSIYGERNRVDHCRIEGKTSEGATLVVWLTGEPNGHLIDHNFFGPRPALGENGGETIRVGDSETSMSISRTVVEFNRFQECDGEAEIISNKSCENVYRYNTFARCSGTLTLRHGNRCVVEGNFFLGEKARGTGGVRIIGEGHRVINNYFERLEGSDARGAIVMMGGIPDSPLSGYFQVKQAVVAFNTLVDCKQTLVIGLFEGDQKKWLAPEGCTVANNLLVGRRGPLVDLRMSPLDFHWIGNLVSGEGELGASGLDQGFQRVEISLEADEGGLRRFGPSCPTIDAAVGDFSVAGEDIDGQPREGLKDVGCDEYSEAPVQRRPLKSQEVGPSWSNGT